MTEKCKVLKWNECVMVIDFKGTEIQMPSVNKIDYIYVKFENEKYSIVTKDDYEKSLVVNKKRFVTGDTNGKTDDK